MLEGNAPVVASGPQAEPMDFSKPLLLDGEAHRALPAVRLHDIRTGATLASYGCILGRVSVEGE